MVVTMARYLVPLLTTGSGGGGHGHILLQPLWGKGRGGGDHIPTHSVLFWEREGVRVTMVRYPLPLPTKGMGGSLFLEREGLVVKSIQTSFSSGKGRG